MQARTLTVAARLEVGKQAAGRLRREGKLPGVFYGKKLGNIPVAIPVKELQDIITREGENAILEVCLAGAGGERQFSAVIREVQRHPLNRKLAHVDLYQISLEDKLRTVVPLVITGEAAGVKAGGVVQQGVRELEVEGIATELPDSINVDISNLGLGEHLTVADIKVSPGLKVLLEPEAVVVAVVAVRAAETDTGVEKPEVEEVAPTEGEPQG